MRLFLSLFLFGMLATSCIDKDYDLSEIDTDGVVIGDEFRLPLATVTVGMSELSKGDTDIKALFDEADIWLPSPLPGGEKSVDLQKIQDTPSYTQRPARRADRADADRRCQDQRRGGPAL